MISKPTVDKSSLCRWPTQSIETESCWCYFWNKHVNFALLFALLRPNHMHKSHFKNAIRFHSRCDEKSAEKRYND